MASPYACSVCRLNSIERSLVYSKLVSPRLPLQETMSGLARVLEILGVLALAAAAGVGWIVADRGLRDLVAISHQAARISRTRDLAGDWTFSEQPPRLANSPERSMTSS